MSTIPTYPAPALPLTGTEQLAAWQDGQQIAPTVEHVAQFAAAGTAVALRPLLDQASAALNASVYRTYGTLEHTDQSVAVGNTAFWGPTAAAESDEDLDGVSALFTGATTGRVVLYAPGHGTLYPIAVSPVLAAGPDGVGAWKADVDLPQWIVPKGSVLVWKRESGGEQLFGVVNDHEAWSLTDGGNVGNTAAGTTTNVSMAMQWTTRARASVAPVTTALPVSLGYSAETRYPSSTSNQAFIQDQPLDAELLLTSLTVGTRTAGGLCVAFFSSDGTPKIVIPVYMPAAGETTFVAGVDFPAGYIIRKGWRRGVILHADVPYAPAALTGVNVYGACRVGTIAGDVFTQTDMSPALSFPVKVQGLAVPPSADPSLTTRRRLPIVSADLTQAQPTWTSVGAWTSGAQGLASPSSGQGWGCYLDTGLLVRVDRRLTRLAFTAASAAAVIGLGARASDGDVTIGPSMMLVDFAARKLSVKRVPTGTGDPGDKVSVALAAGHVATNPHRLDWSWNRRVHTLTLVDLASGATTTVTDDNSASTNVTYGSGTANTDLTLWAVAGQFTASALDVLYDGRKPKVFASGDSKDEGYGLSVPQRWPALLEAQLGAGTVAVSALTGSTAASAFGSLIHELPALRPDWLVLTPGTNDGSSYGSSDDQAARLTLFKAVVSEAVQLALALGCRVVVALLKDTPGSFENGSYAAYNAFLIGLAGQYPGRVKLWRWDIVEADASLLQADGVHRDAAGEVAVEARLVTIDAPEILD